jgi:proline iminopeptidase
MDCLYPTIEPFAEHRIPVSKLHTLHFEQCGNPDGKPVLFIHGGPGGGINAIYRQFFDPNYYHIILVDQRGAGKSTPHAETKENNTQNLINDFEIIRQQLNIKKWMLFGGSWGSTLGLAYAQAHPECVTEMVLRGIYLASDIENQWLFGGQGANRIFPDYWQSFVNLIPEAERYDMLAAYHRRLNHEDPKIQKQAADAWSGWEISISKLHHDPEAVSAFLASPSGVAMATLECHYMYNGCFLEENQLLHNMDKITHLPGHIVQGRYDTVCAPACAWTLHQAWPDSKLHFVTEAGHSMTDPALAKKLVEITDLIKNNSN